MMAGHSKIKNVKRWLLLEPIFLIVRYHQIICVSQTGHYKESYISNTIKRCFMARKYLVDEIEWEEVTNFKSFLQITAGAGMSVLAMKGFMITHEFMNGSIQGI